LTVGQLAVQFGKDTKQSELLIPFVSSVSLPAGTPFRSNRIPLLCLLKQQLVDNQTSFGLVTTSITLTLLFRSLGAVLFGLLAGSSDPRFSCAACRPSEADPSFAFYSDRFGRKWTLVSNLLIVAILQLGSGFVNTYPQFLAVRRCGWQSISTVPSAHLSLTALMALLTCYSLFGIGMGGSTLFNLVLVSS
jgi:MFS family permease